MHDESDMLSQEVVQQIHDLCLQAGLEDRQIDWVPGGLPNIPPATVYRDESYLSVEITLNDENDARSLAKKLGSSFPVLECKIQDVADKDTDV